MSLSFVGIGVAVCVCPSRLSVVCCCLRVVVCCVLCVVPVLFNDAVVLRRVCCL